MINQNELFTTNTWNQQWWKKKSKINDNRQKANIKYLNKMIDKLLLSKKNINIHNWFIIIYKVQICL